jgi:predicted transcriptional regulator
MCASEHSVLVTVVERYDDTGEPLSTATIAALADGDHTAVADALDTLATTEFLVRTPSGYRPTVTAREFLALDVTLDDVVALEVIEKE